MDARLQNAGVLPLLIQTFVENSIKYAVSSGKVLQIHVEAVYLNEHFYQLTIWDTGKGYPKYVLENMEKLVRGEKLKKMSGVGMVNAIERLKIIYGAEVKITIKNREPAGAYIEFVLPLTDVEDDEGE